MNRFLHLILNIIWFLLTPFFLLQRIIYSRKVLSLNKNDLVVVITGCDTGMGNMLAKELINLGYIVIATCLTKEGADQLEKEVSSKSHLSTVLCDVTKVEDIKKVESQLKELYEKNGKLKLWAVVNNAGIAPSGFIDWIPMTATRKIFEVNVYPIITMAQAFLPYLKEVKHSRIINMSSAASICASNGGGIYCGKYHFSISRDCFLIIALC
jgi:NAD(P)-dependent dehydrogenase (short-subunit alcohol dehydrogenase family)